MNDHHRLDFLQSQMSIICEKIESGHPEKEAMRIKLRELKDEYSIVASRINFEKYKRGGRP